MGALGQEETPASCARRSPRRQVSGRRLAASVPYRGSGLVGVPSDSTLNRLPYRVSREHSALLPRNPSELAPICGTVKGADTFHREEK